VFKTFARPIAHSRTVQICFGLLLILLLNCVASVFILRKVPRAQTSPPQSSWSGDRRALAWFLLGRLQSSLEENARERFEYLAAHSRGQRQEIEGRWKRSSEAVREATERYGSFVGSQADQSAYTSLKQDTSRYLETGLRIMSPVAPPHHKGPRSREKSRAQADGRALLAEEEREFQRSSADVQALLASAEHSAREPRPLPVTGDTSIRWQLGIILGIGAALGLILALLATYRFTQILREIAAASAALAAGDLSPRPVKPGSRDEAGEIASHLETVRNRIAALVQEAASSTERMIALCQPIATASRRQTEGATAQHEQLQEIANSMVERAAKVSAMTRQSLRAAQAARHAGECAGRRRAVLDSLLIEAGGLRTGIHQSSGALAEMEKCSGRIVTLVPVVEELARRIHAIAQGAAAEAARAGEEAGEFGIAAWEVQKLAERARLAAKEMGEGISQIQNGRSVATAALLEASCRAESAMQAASQTGEIWQELAAAVHDVGGAISHLGTSSEEIARDRKNADRLSQISQIGMETMEAARHIANAAELLRDQAATLNAAVRDFAPSNQLSPGAIVEEKHQEIQPPHMAGWFERECFDGENDGENLDGEREDEPASFMGRAQDFETMPAALFHAPSSVSAERTG
jgi:methyl-accepting chemotaxis protein